MDVESLRHIAETYRQAQIIVLNHALHQLAGCLIVGNEAKVYTKAKEDIATIEREYGKHIMEIVSVMNNAIEYAYNSGRTENDEFSEMT